MKKKSLLLPISLLLTLTSCEETKPEPVTPAPVAEHEHTFSYDYSYDNEYHWFEATCEHKDKVKGKLKHIFGQWKVERDSSIAEEGLKTRKCSICGYVDSELIPKKSSKGLVMDNPLNINETIDLMKDYTAGQVSTAPYYIQGVVAEAFYKEDFGSYNLYFVDHESTSEKPFQVYSAVIDTNFVHSTYDAETIIGATVKVYGYLKLYHNTTTNVDVYECSYLKSNESPTGNQVSPTIIEVVTNTPPIHTHTFSESWTSDENAHWHVATCEHTDLTTGYAEHTFGEWITDTAATSTTKGSKHRTCSVCTYREDDEIPVINTGNGTFTLYTFNDFHGAVNEYSSQKHIGLAKFGTYLKNVSKNENVVIVDSGDTFQGSIESNYNNGAMITDVFNYAHVDVHTLGNHDFDWGEDKIEANKARKNAGDNWQMVNLGANIYDYTFSTHYEGNVQQSRLGDKYYIKTLENGLRVGIVGVIGRDQITSICSPLVEDICFKEHIQVLKDVSDELRVNQNCDAVIASIHNSGEDTIGKGLADVSPVSGKKYFDYVACGHSHYNENLEENGVHYTQAASYGECIYKAQFTLTSGSVTNCNVTCLDYNTVTSAASTVDPNITSIINSYAAEYSSVGNELIASSTSGTFYKDNQMPNLLCKAVYETANSGGYNVDMACCNVARYNVSGSSWKYSQIYEAFPFDNVIYIVKIKGSKNVKEACYSGNYCYHKASLTSMNSNTWYTIAVIDYLLWHTNSSRDYDYFSHNSSYMQVIDTLKKSNGDNFLYRDICANYVRGLSGTIRNTDYSNSVTEFTKPSVDA